MKTRDRAWIAAYAVLVAAIAFAISHDALMVQDGDALMDMTRGLWLRGSLEIKNGLDITDSLDLVLKQTSKIGPLMYGKYPALYCVLAAVPVGLLGARGMYLVNAIALAAIVVVYHALASQVLSRRAAFWSSLALPFVVPLFSYAEMELPHLVSAVLVLGGVAASVAAIRSDARVFWIALGAGVLLGFALGVRLQNATVCAAVTCVIALRARRRGHAVLGAVVGQLACVVAMVVLNRERFGAFTPFSYGKNPLGGNHETETAHYFVSSPVLLFALAYPFLLLLAFRRAPRASVAERVLSFGLLGALLLLAPLRHQLARMFASACVLLVKSTAFLDETPSSTFGWINKTLLYSAPLLVLGLAGIVACAIKRAPVLLEMASAICVALLVFLSIRNPDPATEQSTIGFLGFSPRYLVDLFPLLLLLAFWMLRGVKLRATFYASATFVFVALGSVYAKTLDDTDARRKFIVLTLSLALAAFVLVAFALRRVRVAAAMLPIACGAAAGYSCAVTIGCDTVALTRLGSRYQEWGERVESLTPARFVLIGWDNAKDPIYAIRAHRDAIFVNASVDSGEALRSTLAKLSPREGPIFYFGLELERVMPMIEHDYWVVQVCDDPLLWRFDPR